MFPEEPFGGEWEEEGEGEGEGEEGAPEWLVAAEARLRRGRFSPGAGVAEVRNHTTVLV
jgi:hypothetical protein